MTKAQMELLKTMKEKGAVIHFDRHTVACALWDSEGDTKMRTVPVKMFRAIKDELTRVAGRFSSVEYWAAKG